VFKQREREVGQKAVKPASRERRAERKEPARKSSRSNNAILRYFQETSVELRKVSWPTREATTRLTLIVLGATAAFAAFLGTLDILFQQGAALLLK
jgi:preprotein translocase SecE subunit